MKKACLQDAIDRDILGTEAVIRAGEMQEGMVLAHGIDDCCKTRPGIRIDAHAFGQLWILCPEQP